MLCQSKKSSNKVNTKNVFHILINNAEKIFIKKFFIFFLKISQSYQLIPKWILLRKNNCVGNSSKGFKKDWKKKKKNFVTYYRKSKSKIIFSMKRIFGWLWTMFLLMVCGFLDLKHILTNLRKKNNRKNVGSSGVCICILRKGNLHWIDL